MKIKRRQFLGLFSSIALASIARSGDLTRIDSASFRSPALGLQFVMPVSWSRVSADVFQLLKEDQLRIEENRSPDEVQPSPVIVLTRYLEPYPEMNPSIALFADKHEAWMGNSPVEFGSDFLEYYSETVVRPTIIEQPHLVVFGGVPCSRSVLDFDFEGRSSLRHRVRMRSMWTFHRGHLLYLQLTDSSDGTEDASAEFSLIEGSITFDNTISSNRCPPV